jgi:hypothetical protein
MMNCSGQWATSLPKVTVKTLIVRFLAWSRRFRVARARNNVPLAYCQSALQDVAWVSALGLQEWQTRILVQSHGTWKTWAVSLPRAWLRRAYGLRSSRGGAVGKEQERSSAITRSQGDQARTTWRTIATREGAQIEIQAVCSVVIGKLRRKRLVQFASRGCPTQTQVPVDRWYELRRIAYEPRARKAV